MSSKNENNKDDPTKNLLRYTVRWDGFARNGLHKDGLVKRRDAKGEHVRWAALVFNYLVFYHNKKNQPPDSTTDEAWYERLYPILKIENLGPLADGKGHGFQFDDPKEPDPRNKTVKVILETWEEQEEWLKKITKVLRELQRALGELDKLGGPEHVLQEMMREIPKGYNPGHVNQPEDIPGFAANMKRSFVALRSYHVNAGLLRNFGDYYNQNTKLYLDWIMVGLVDENATRHIQKIEKQNVDSWKENITSTVKDVNDMIETRFFREDLEAGLKRAQEAISWIEAYAHYARTVHEDWPLEFLAEREILKLFVELAQKLPFSKELSLESLGPGQGVVQKGLPKSTGYRAEKWTWAPVPGKQPTTMRLQCTSHANVPAFLCTNGFEIVSEGWGAVLWNRVSWCWFHPKIRFTIRYDWISTDKKFRFHRHRDKKAGELALPDWRWTGQSVEPVFDSKPEKITFDVFHAIGQVPAPIVLLVATLFHLQETVSLQLPNVPPPTRIHVDEQNAVYYRQP